MKFVCHHGHEESVRSSLTWCAISTSHIQHLQVLVSLNGFHSHPSGKHGRARDFSFHAIIRGCISMSHMRHFQIANIGKLLDFCMMWDVFL